MKRGKTLYFMFCWLVLGVDPAQNLIKYKKVVACAEKNLPICFLKPLRL